MSRHIGTRTVLIFVLGCTLLLLASQGRSLFGLAAYNMYDVRLAAYLYEVHRRPQDQVPVAVSRGLTDAAAWGNRRAQAQLSHLQAVSGETNLEAIDPLVFQLGLRDWQIRQVGASVPRASWQLLQTGSAGFEAEEVQVVGISYPNPFVTFRDQGQTKYAVLYWRHNSLRSEIAIRQAGVYSVSVRAIDWPPAPLQIALALGGQRHVLRWESGDQKWYTQTIELELDAGLTILQLTYLPPSGNRAQSANIDWVEINRIN